MAGVGTLCWMIASLTPWQTSLARSLRRHRGPLWAPLGKQTLACLGDVLNRVCETLG